jgi:hypothetical protein
MSASPLSEPKQGPPHTGSGRRIHDRAVPHLAFEAVEAARMPLGTLLERLWQRRAA